ncbi:MAG: replication P family protein [Pseudomonadaceae bacterium]|nr:replication P family protein [Pseudomonadaceae bacterium]
MSGAVKASALVSSIKPQHIAALQAPKVVEVDPATRQVINELFETMKGIKPAWRQCWPTQREYDSAKLEWLAAFMRNGICQIEQIQNGIRMAAASTSPFVPPTGEFVAWCFAPEGFGLPSAERAYAQAVRNGHPAQMSCARWSHPAVFHAAVAAGFSTLQRLESGLGLKRFAAKYLEQCKKLARGEELAPAPVAALPAPQNMGSPEVAAAQLAAMREKLGVRRG